MKRCTVSVVGLAPYSASRKFEEPMLDRESHEDFERRTWREKCTVNGDGVVCVPAMGWKQGLDTTAYKLGMKVPNRRGATYKNFFLSGFLCESDAPLHRNGHALRPADAECVPIWANSDGVRGSGKRVLRLFPSFPQWETEISFMITDDIITEDVFEQHAKACGIICGVGRFRAEKGGLNGRFRVVKIVWEAIKL